MESDGFLPSLHRRLKGNECFALPDTFKAVFFVLQTLFYLRSGLFVGSGKELLEALSGNDLRILETSTELSKGKSFDFDEVFSMLFSWCRETLAETASFV